MLVTCPNQVCAAAFEIKDTFLPCGQEKKVICAYCRTRFTVVNNEESNENAGAPFDPSRDATMMLNLWNKPQKSAGSGPLQAKRTDPPKLMEQLLPLPSQELEEEDGKNEESAENLKLPPILRGIQQKKEKKIPILERLPMDAKKKASMIYSVKWIPDLEWKEMQLFGNYWEVVKAERGAFIFKQGDHTPYMAILFFGCIHLYEHLQDQDQPGKEILKINAGYSLGELNLFGGFRRASYAMAHEESYILILTRKRFRQLSEHHPDIWKAVVIRLMDLAGRWIESVDNPRYDSLQRGPLV